MTPEMMTLPEFERWIRQNFIRLYVWPFRIRPCTCGDVNCHGWRLVTREQ